MEGHLDRARDLVFDRVGQTLALDMLAVRNDSGDASTFAAMASRVANEGLPMVLMSDRPEALRQAAAGLTRPLLYAATAENVEEMAAVAKELKCPLALRSEDLNTLADMAERARKAGVEDLMLDLAPQRAKDLVEKNTIVRKNAVKKTFRGLGYPIILNACDDERAVLKAMLSTMKYGGIVLLDDLDPPMLPLFVLRQNIYTDPQVPIQVKAGLYPVNDPREIRPYCSLPTLTDLLHRIGRHREVQGPGMAPRRRYRRVVGPDGVLGRQAVGGKRRHRAGRDLEGEEQEGYAYHTWNAVPHVGQTAGAQRPEGRGRPKGIVWNPQAVEERPEIEGTVQTLPHRRGWVCIHLSPLPFLIMSTRGRHVGYVWKRNVGMEVGLVVAAP